MPYVNANACIACRNCEQNDIKVPFAKAKSPKPLISGSLASPSLVASITYQKHANGMPLYRLENGFRYDGVSISRQNILFRTPDGVRHRTG